MTKGNKIKALRQTSGITQEQLANMIGTTKQTIFKYENDLITNIPINKLEVISEVLHVSPAYLMGWDKKEKPTTVSDDGLAEVMNIFLQLTPDNRAKLLELCRLYLGAQNNNRENQ
ncbi:MAG: helix-turn-helix transcriptional regulator [Oscillospiraceae bacterium]